MFEEVRLAASEQATSFQIIEISVESNLAQGNDHLHPLESLNLAIEKLRAFGEFLRQRLVVGRRAPHRRRNVQIFQLESVVAIGCRGLAGESGLMQDWIHKLAGSISGKGTTSTIGAVRARGQSQDEHPRLSIAKPGHRPAPVVTLTVSASFHPSHFFAIRHQAWTARAGN